MDFQIWEDRGLHLGITGAELATYKAWFTNWAGHVSGEVFDKNGRDVFIYNSFDPALKEGRRYFTVQIPASGFKDKVTGAEYTPNDLIAMGIKLDHDQEYVAPNGTVIPERYTMKVNVSYRFEEPDIEIEQDGEWQKYTRTGENDTLEIRHLDRLSVKDISLAVHFGRRSPQSNMRACYLDNFYAKTISNPIAAAHKKQVDESEIFAQVPDFDPDDPMA